jgi:hypothetical protein
MRWEDDDDDDAWVRIWKGKSCRVILPPFP